MKPRVCMHRGNPMKTNPVRSRFAVPVAVALAVHAFLFFGFTHGNATGDGAVNKPKAKPPIAEPPIPVDIERTEIDDPIVDQKTQTAATPVPDIPDSIGVKDDSTLTVPLEPLMSGPIVPGIHIIPTGPIGEGPGNLPTTIYRGSELDNPPRAVFQAKPVYPYSMRSTGMSGDVLVNFMVDERGNVVDARVVRSTNREFEEPTLRAVSHWRFEPGKRHGRVVRFRMTLPVTFAVGNE